MNSSSSASSSSHGMPNLSASYDHDLDNFLDLDQSTYTPTSASPALGKQPLHRPSFASSNNSFAGNQSQQTFSGPSFQYDAYKQQTGLPVGGLANTFAVNQAMGMQYTGHHQGFVMPTETLNMPLSTLDDFDFGKMSNVDMQDVDFEDDSPSDVSSMFFPSASSSKGQFVNPNALVGQEDSPTYSAPVQRMYPGMHSQQAAQAKAQQVQKQQELARQQQLRQLEGQRSLPTQSKTPSQKDPHVEESISRLLSQMRHNSVASADEASTPTGNAPSLAARLKKEEDDMDEDERLLASEEGKKLSSKERRQLRNKVSARAFRSRRKEYIGQLEGEVAQKVQEADELRAQNRQLLEENTRLTDLTRMLLSSSAFSGFLNELGANGTSAPAVPATAAPRPAQSQPRPTRKDVNPHQAAQQVQSQQPQINMALMPESIDFSVLDQPMNNWSSLPSNDFSVFNVNVLPEGPSLDLRALSGKGSESKTSKDSAKELPVLPEVPSWVIASESVPVTSTAVSQDNELDQDAFSLYTDQLPSSALSSFSTPLNFTKPVNDHYTLVLSSTADEATKMAELKRMCALLDETCNRLASFTSHL